MSLTQSHKHAATTLDIDALLQDSYLLVVELRQGGSAQNSLELWALCVKQIERVRHRLTSAGMSQRSIDHISHAQCALLDETVLTCATGDTHATWASEPLQAKFFNRHQAGEFLYEDMREVLREPAPDRQVLTAFQRVLMLGFCGRYRDANDPEREQLLSALNAQVAPLSLTQTLATCTRVGAVSPLSVLQSPVTQALMVGLLLVGGWWVLDHLLGEMVATLSSQA